MKPNNKIKSLEKQRTHEKENEINIKNFKKRLEQKWSQSYIRDDRESYDFY